MNLELGALPEVSTIPVAGSPKPAGTTINTEVPRIDGKFKTTGTAKYSSDHNLPGLLYAVPVGSTIANGYVASIDTAKAAAMRGVVKIYTRENLPKVYGTDPNDRGTRVDERRMPFSDDKINYVGQYVALVVAKTMNQAREAAASVVVRYNEAKPNVTRDLSDGMVEDQMRQFNKRGDALPAFDSGAVKIDETYVAPITVHNPIEMHASVAHWTGKKFVLYETTQSIFAQRSLLAQMLGVPKEQVQVVMQYLGSGFGGKLWPWPHSVLTAVASRDLNAPVKLVVDRHMMFKNVGNRAQTTQRMRLSATPEGKLTSVVHDYASTTSLISDLAENCGQTTPVMYSTPNMLVRSNIVHRTIGCNTAMRGPGAVPGLYALESAMDELAVKLKIDPVQLRLLNEPKIDESTGRPFSSRHLVECMAVGASKFGWSKRNPEIGSMRRGDLVLGWGMAACSYRSNRGGCKTTVRLSDDGRAHVLCGTQDIGVGTYTIFAQIVQAKTGVPVNQVDVQLGDTDLPEAPHSGGSWTTGTILPAIDQACDLAIQSLFTTAAQTSGSPFHGVDAADLVLTDGKVHRRSEPASAGIGFGELLKRAGMRAVTGEGEAAGSFGGPPPSSVPGGAAATRTQTSEGGRPAGAAAQPSGRARGGPPVGGTPGAAGGVSSHSFGAQFVEVEWDPGIARLRVSRVVSVLDVGRIINLKTARNQAEGGIVMGIGMGMFEEAIYDQRTGRPINANLADYIVSTNPDCPEIDAVFTDYPDAFANSYGARGCGEISMAGTASAITAAVYHATGIRVRELPVKLEHLLTA